MTEYTLYHLWLSPFSRKVRFLLNEKGCDYDMVIEKVWERREEFLKINPAGQVPVLMTNDGRYIVDSQAISEYIEEVIPSPNLLGRSPLQKAETRRLTAWFDNKFFHEVSKLFLNEKVMKRFLGLGQPNSKAIRAAQTNIHYHLDYIGWLSERRGWLSGDELSMADISAAAHISCIDYLGSIPWDEHSLAKDWYARVKSRPTFRSILDDNIPGNPPVDYYSDLDF